MDLMVSPLHGADGNVEFLLHARPARRPRPDRRARRRRDRRRDRSAPAVTTVGLVVHGERTQAGRAGPRDRRLAARPRATGSSCPRRTRRAPASRAASTPPRLGVEADVVAQPRRRRHDAALGRPRRRARRAGARHQRRPARLPDRGRSRRLGAGARPAGSAGDAEVDERMLLVGPGRAGRRPSPVRSRRSRSTRRCSRRPRWATPCGCGCTSTARSSPPTRPTA